MDAKTLSIILGHASVAFTSDTYMHILTEHKHDGMALMEELYNVQPVASGSQPYPIVIIFTPDGPIDISVLNFPEYHIFR